MLPPIVMGPPMPRITFMFFLHGLHVLLHQGLALLRVGYRPAFSRLLLHSF
jgi:hypothetical protein